MFRLGATSTPVITKDMRRWTAKYLDIVGRQRADSFEDISDEEDKHSTSIQNNNNNTTNTKESQTHEVLTEIPLSTSNEQQIKSEPEKSDFLISFEGLNDLTLDAIKFGDVEEDDHYLKHHKMKSKEVPLTTLTSSRGSEQLESLPPQPPPSESKWQQFKRRCPYYVPIFYWLPRYNFKRDFPRDLVAGLTVGSLMLPQCIAVAILATLDPIYGLYTALITPLVYAILGTSRQLSVGPDTMVSLLVAIELNRQREVVDHGTTAQVFAFMVGVFLFTIGLLRFGFLDNIISRPLLCGFVNAVALLIWISQLEPLFGLIPNTELTGWHKIPYIWSNQNNINYYALLLGVSAIVFMGGIRVAKTLARHSQRRCCVWIHYLPETLLALILGIGASYFFDLQQYGLHLIGSIKASFPLPKLPNFTSIQEIEINIMSSLTIAVIGFIESIIVAKLYANKNNYYVSPNRELVAVGMANIVGSFFGTYPAFGSLTRSSVANLMRAATQLYAVIGSLLIFGTVLFLQADIQLFWYLPKVVLAAVIIIAASGLVEVNDILFMWQIRAWKDLLLFLMTFLLTIVLGVDLGIFIALAVSVFLVIRHSSLPHIAVLGRMPKSKSYRDIAQFPQARIIPGIIIVRIEESLYFANIEMIKQILNRLESVGSFSTRAGERRSTSDSSNVIGAVIIHARYISSVDANAVEVLSEMAENYRKRGIFLAWVKLRDNIKKQFLRAGIIQNTLADVHLFNSVDDAVRFVKEKMQRDRQSNTPRSEKIAQ